MAETWIIAVCVLFLAATSIIGQIKIQKQIDKYEARVVDAERQLALVEKRNDIRYKTVYDRADQVASDNKVRCEELGKKLEWFEKKLEELPTEQIQQIYDSEKQFQDGLSSILNYFGPPKENEAK